MNEYNAVHLDRFQALETAYLQKLSVEGKELGKAVGIPGSSDNITRERLTSCLPLFHLPSLVVSDYHQVIDSILACETRSESSKLRFPSYLLCVLKKRILICKQ